MQAALLASAAELTKKVATENQGPGYLFDQVPKQKGVIHTQRHPLHYQEAAS